MTRILRARAEGVSPVVAEILLVAITVVLAAVVYLMASGILAGHTEPMPIVGFAAGATFLPGSHNVSLEIAGASQAQPATAYAFNLRVGLAYGAPTSFAASLAAADIAVNGTTYRVTWIDVDGGGMLTGGDRIEVTGSGVSLATGTAFEFLLLWHDGTVLTAASWHT